MRWGNCLPHALRAFLSGRYRYLWVRWSHWGPFPHFGVAREVKDSEQFVPVDARRRLIPPPFYRGEVRRGDDPPRDDCWCRGCRRRDDAA